jgi:sporulation protein YlmC with PRC-barrel domain
MTVAMTREQLEQLPEYQDPNQQAAAGGQGGGDQGAAGQNAVLSPPIVAPDPTAPAGAAPAAAGTDPNAAGAGQDQAAADAQTQFQPVTREMSADDLMGAAVYSQNEENLGEVGDVIFDAQGAAQAVVVDVGGFLGIGEKPVALQYSAVQVQQNGNGDIRILVNATQEQLQNAPSYAEAAAAAQGGGAQPAPQPAPQ